MRGDERGAGLARRTEGPEDPRVERNEGAQADGDGVRGLVRVEVVVRELEPRDDQHPVADECPLGLQVDRGDVGVEVPGVDEGATVPGALLHRPRVIAPERVVGHAGDVEARSTVEIDELPESERSVAPEDVPVAVEFRDGGPGVIVT
ncbi:MAG: hypothetical protein ACRDNG_08825 [Gaiellaceae bacterium]